MLTDTKLLEIFLLQELNIFQFEYFELDIRYIKKLFWDC